MYLVLLRIASPFNLSLKEGLHLTDFKLEPKHIDGSPTKIGTVGGKDLMQIRCKGGFYMLVTKKPKGFNILAAAAHPLLARKKVSNDHKDVDFTELSKAEHVPAEHYALLMPDCEELTALLRKANGEEV